VVAAARPVLEYDRVFCGRLAIWTNPEEELKLRSTR
jgi:hypothetical protein